MTNENDTNVQEVESQEEVITSEQETSTEEEVAETPDDSVTLTKAEYTKLKRQAIAYKSQKESSPDSKSSSNISKDELYLVAKGYSDQAIEQLAVIAKGSGVGLREAISNDLFKLFQEKEQAATRKAKSNIGASNGSGYNQPAPLIKPNMTDAEHNAAWKKVMSGK